MKDQKKKICLVTNWYPDKENPYRGSFFKEQAFAMSECFDFIVVHYIENKKVPLIKYLVQCAMRKDYSVERVNSEENTVEYNVNVSFPFYTMYVDKLYDLYVRFLKGRSLAGVGQFVSNTYSKRKKKNIEKVFKYNFPEEFDALYCIDAQSEAYTLQLIAEATQKPYIVSEHAPFPWPGSTIKDVERSAIMNADLFLAISYDKIRQVMLQNINLNKIAYVGNMVDEETFKLRKTKNKVKTFIMVGAHSFYKNYPMFVEVFNQLTEITNCPFKVMIVGYGANKGYSKNVDQLENKIRESKFISHVEFIPEVSREEIHELYERADAFVMTSVQEGMPVAALEAGCCGLPIFSTMCGGVEDYVDENIGRIYKMMDVDAFANGLKQFLEEDIIFDSEYIRTHIVQRFGKQAFVQNMKEIFLDAIEDVAN